MTVNGSQGAEASQTGGGQPGRDTDVGDTGRTYLEHVDSTPDAPSEQMSMSMSDSSGNSALELAQVDVKLANDPARQSLERRGVSVHHLITEFKDAVVEAGIDIFNDSSSLVYDVVVRWRKSPLLSVRTDKEKDCPLPNIFAAAVEVSG